MLTSRFLGKHAPTLILMTTYAILVVYLSLAAEYFCTLNNLTTIGQTVAVIGIMAAAQTIVIISGGLDLSIGSVVALTVVMVSLLESKGVPIIWSASASLGIAAVVGMINGNAVTRLKINPFITTLAMLSIASGLAFVLSSGRTNLIESSAFRSLGIGRIAGVPASILIMAIVFAATHLLLSATRYGRAIYAVGGNYEACRLSGVDVGAVRRKAYLLSSLSAGLAGIILAAQLGAAAPQSARGYELQVIAAVILGGTSLTGGAGNAIGTLLGVLTLGTLRNGLDLMHVDFYWQEVVMGIALGLAVSADRLRQLRSPAKGIPD